MTEYVLVSDLHGNAPALRAVIDDEGSDKPYIVLGDIMGLLGYPKETLDLVQSVGQHVIAGNHDKALFEHSEGHVNDPKLSDFEYENTVDSLSTKDIEWMRELSYLMVVQNDARICLCHAMPYPEKASGFEIGNAGVSKRYITQHASVVASDYDYVFCGHTHEQYEQDCSKWAHDVHFVNPGSLGYDGAYATVDTKSGIVELKQVEYNDGVVKERVRSTLPDDAPSVERWFPESLI